MNIFDWRTGPPCGLLLLGLLAATGCGKADKPAAENAAKSSTTEKKTSQPESASRPDGILVSGLQPGDHAGAYNVRDITGPAAGQSLCYRWRYGSRPVINVFARTFTDDLASLVKQIDEAVSAHQDEKLAAFVVFLTDDSDKAEPQIKELAKSVQISQTPLTMFEGVAGPPAYKIAQNADVTVMLWRGKQVEHNFAFGKGELNADHIGEIATQVEKFATQ